MVGKQYMIDGIVERIMLYTLNPNSISIETDSRKRSFSEDQLMEWAKKCLPVQDDLEVLQDNMSMTPGNSKMAPAVQNTAAVNTVVYQPSFTSNNFSELRNILMKNIEKVQESKDYLPQAVAVRDNVQSVIELTKNEIEYAKVLNRMSR